MDSAKVKEIKTEKPLQLQSPVNSYQSCISDWPRVVPQPEDCKVDDKERVQEIYRDQLRSSVK